MIKRDIPILNPGNRYRISRCHDVDSIVDNCREAKEKEREGYIAEIMRSGAFLRDINCSCRGYINGRSTVLVSLRARDFGARGRETSYSRFTGRLTFQWSVKVPGALGLDKFFGYRRFIKPGTILESGIVVTDAVAAA